MHLQRASIGSGMTSLGWRPRSLWSLLFCIPFRCYLWVRGSLDRWDFLCYWFLRGTIPFLPVARQGIGWRFGCIKKGLELSLSIMMMSIESHHHSPTPRRKSIDGFYFSYLNFASIPTYFLQCLPYSHQLPSSKQASWLYRPIR